MARLQFLVIFALLGCLLSGNARPVNNDVADVVHLARDVPQFVNLEARQRGAARRPAPRPAPRPAAVRRPVPAAKRPAVRKAPVKAPRKTAVAKKAAVKKVAVKKTAAPKKVAAPKKAPVATKKTAKKTAKGAKKVAEPEFCEIPVKGAKGVKTVKGVKTKRGCTSSKLADPDAAAPAKKTPAPAPPPLAKNQIRLNNRVFTVGRQLGQGANGIAFDVTGSPNLIAKQFKGSATQDEFNDEQRNLQTARLLTAAGRSTLGPTGAASNWIITTKVAGKKLTTVQEFITTMAGPRAACLTYLEGIYTQFVTKYVALQASTGLFHGDATNENTFFNDNSQLVDFIDFGNMKTSLAALKAQEFNPALSGAATIQDFARARAQINWPTRACQAA